MHTHPLLNITTLNEAKALLGEKFPTITGFFFEDSAEYIATILAGFAAGDAQMMVLPAHSLKSSAKQMGADKLSYLAREIELGAKESLTGKAALGSLQAAVTEIETTLAQTIAAFAEYR